MLPDESPGDLGEELTGLPEELLEANSCLSASGGRFRWRCGMEGNCARCAASRVVGRGERCQRSQGMADDAVGLAGLFGGRRFLAVQPALPALWVETGDPGKRTKWSRDGQAKGDRQDRDENDN